ncbi:unnamed protein product [Arabis nemorensis]|uniref:Pre-mRNA-splicing factor SLU7 n=1 Tax=Arabis nemorensis TaxID=586526 RepID=A0A565CMD2_9BRAS|nr:unnamed protein product [Arabis nemorensis]
MQLKLIFCLFQGEERLDEKKYHIREQEDQIIEQQELYYNFKDGKKRLKLMNAAANGDLPKSHDCMGTRLEEDLLMNGHKSVWGLWWKAFQWGYACCHQTDRQSHCTK